MAPTSDRSNIKYSINVGELVGASSRALYFFMPTSYNYGMRPTSVDLRKRVVAARINDGQSMGEIAARFKMPKGTVQNILERYRDSGTVLPKPANSGRRPAFSGAALIKLEKDVLDHPDSTLEELRDRSGMMVSLVCIHKTLRKLGFTRKKKLYVRMNNNVRPSQRNAQHGAKD